MNRQQGDIYLQYQKGELSREEATDKILHHALKSRRQLFKHDDDDDDDDDDDNDDDVQGAEGGKESEDEEYFDTSDVLSPEDRERALIKKNIQTDKVLDLIANVVLFQCGISPFKFKSFPNKFRIWNNSSSCFMCNTSKIY